MSSSSFDFAVFRGATPLASPRAPLLRNCLHLLIEDRFLVYMCFGHLLVGLVRVLLVYCLHLLLVGPTTKHLEHYCSQLLHAYSQSTACICSSAVPGPSTARLHAEVSSIKHLISPARSHIGRARAWERRERGVCAGTSTSKQIHVFRFVACR